MPTGGVRRAEIYSWISDATETPDAGGLPRNGNVIVNGGRTMQFRSSHSRWGYAVIRLIRPFSAASENPL